MVDWMKGWNKYNGEELEDKQAIQVRGDDGDLYNCFYDKGLDAFFYDYKGLHLVKGTVVNFYVPQKEGE